MKEIAKMIRMCKGIATSSLEERAKREVCLGPSKFKKTLIFDLDETLIHAQAKVVYKSQRKVQEIDQCNITPVHSKFQLIDEVLDYNDEFDLRIKGEVRPYAKEVIAFLS